MNRLLSLLFVCLIQVSLAVASTFNLNVEVTPNGSGSLSTSGGTYEEGSTVYLRTYNNTGYVFKGWYDGETLLSSSTSFNYTMPAKDVLVKAKYEYDPTVPGNPSMPDTTTYYSFNAIVSPHGAGSLNSINARYAAGATISLRTYNNTGYKFIGWQDEDGVNLSASTSFNYTMPNHNVTLTALYSYDPSVPADPDSMATRYTATIMSKPMGGGSFNTSSATVEEGNNVHLYAYTNTGYQFLHWENEQGEIISAEQSFYYVMPHGNTKVYGVFDFNPAPPSNPNKNHWNKELGEVIADDFTPGSLNSAISTVVSGSNSSEVAMITVAGKMNDNDFGIANNYTNCTLLDLSRVTGVTQIPSYAFDYTNLESVYLPVTIEKIGYRAFYECKQLQALTVYAMIPPELDSHVFTGVQEGLVVYVPAAAIAQYQDTEGWKDFTLLPIQEDIRSISVSLPEGTNAADYTQMWLELTNTKSGQKMHYVMTDRTSYTFANIIRNTSWNVVLRNQNGAVFGQINDIDVKDEDVSVTFASLAKPQNINLVVITPDGTDVTAQTQVTWTDEAGNYLAQAYGLNGLLPETKVGYRVALSQELAMQYAAPTLTAYTVSVNGNDVKCQLAVIQQVQLTGKVKDLTTKSALSGAVVSASQTFGGKYSKTISTKTDASGNYTLTISNVPTSLAIAATDYISQTVVCDSLLTGAETITVPEVSLKAITGAVISFGFTYTSSVTADEEAGVQSWYNDYNNVAYTIFNKTKQQTISQFNVQYPQIVLLEEVEEGDVLELTATSKTSAFMPVKATATIDAEQRANAAFDIVELGKIQATFAKNGNAAVVGSLYNANGKLLKSYDYNNASLTISNLADGNYTLVSMGSSKLFNTIYDLKQLPQTGLVLDSDYVQNAIEVKSGVVSVVSIKEVPTLDESKLYYTGDNTSFTVNKSSIVAGNYLTLTGHLDFKSAYATSVSNVNLIIDLPESCEFVENSVMVGNNTSSYTLNGTRLTIPMARYTDRVRFCVIPTLGGEYAPSAFAQFDLNGETITQPIGSANYTAKDLSISVPSTVAKTSVPIKGASVGASEVDVYDNGVLIGRTNSLTNGFWEVTCELNEPYNYSNHTIYAEVKTKGGLELVSETVDCIYDKNAIEAKTVTMSFYNGWLRNQVEVTWDLQNKTTSSSSYMFYTTTDITFMVDFTNNDVELVRDVELFVFTSDGNHVELTPVYDAKLDKYVAKKQFTSNVLPINVSVSYNIGHKEAVDIAETFDAEVTLIQDIETSVVAKNNMVDLEVITDEDTRTLYKTTIIEANAEAYFEIKELDYNTAILQLQKVQYDFEKTDNGYVYTLVEENNDATSLIIIDKGEEVAYSLVLYDNEPNSVGKIASNKANAAGQFLSKTANLKYLKNLMTSGDWLGSLNTIRGGIGDVLGLNKYAGCPSFNLYFDLMDAYMTEFENLGKILTKALTAQCQDSSYRLSNEDMKKYAEQIKNYDSNIGSIYDVFVSYTELYKAKLKCAVAIEIFKTLGAAALSAGSELGAGAIANSGRVLTNSKNAKYFKYWIDSKIGRGYIENILGIAFGEAIGKIKDFINPEEADFQKVENEMNQWMADSRNSMYNLYNTIMNNIRGSYKNCPPKKDKQTPPPPHTDPINPIHDPSGYVYESVTSNRLEGVMATCYYKEEVEDMYGDLHENIVKWNAEEYAQENPLFTDENGMYAWDVPQGLWQVKFEKEGYETTYSEWLPVPPPQLEVNIAMKQNVQPNVQNVRAYEDAVEVEFDKYMMPELLNTENITVMADGKNVEGTIELLNEEVSHEGEKETFASKVRFNAAKPFDGTEVTLMVNNRVKSYAGIRMQDNFSQTFTVEQEVRKIVCDSVTLVGYGETGTLTVAVLPALASAGKTLNVRTSSSMILSTDVTSIVLDEEGKAEIPVTGELPGTAAITFTIEGYDLSGTTIVNVEQIEYKAVATPTASIASGTTVEKGTEIVLSCTTEGATIYYTLDGSCPCDNTAARKVYDGTPIVINENTTIKAMAVAPNMYDSEVAEFTYIVDGTGIDDVTINDEIEIYPLPVHEKLNVTAGGKIIKSVRVSAMNGVLVASSAKSATKVTIDVSKIPTGIYIINVTTENGIFSRKIQKVK